MLLQTQGGCRMASVAQHQMHGVCCMASNVRHQTHGAWCMAPGACNLPHGVHPMHMEPHIDMHEDAWATRIHTPAWLTPAPCAWSRSRTPAWLTPVPYAAAPCS